MFIQELLIKINADIKKNELIDEFSILLGSFRYNGQLQGFRNTPFLSGNFIKCHVYTLGKNSFDKKYSSNCKVVLQQLRRVEKLFNSHLQVKILGTTFENYTGACNCKTHDLLILFTHLFNISSPIDCGTCFNPIPLYRLTQLDVETREKILHWEENYISCDALQLNSSVGEKWATRQMAEHKSELSKQGIKICETIKKKTGLPAFYYLFNYRSIKIERDKLRPCPSCGKTWLLKKKLHNYDFKCDRCKLISSITSNGY